MPLLTQKEYAARIGRSPPLINRWVKSGRIVLIDGLIDAEDADNRLRETLDTSNRGGDAARARREAMREGSGSSAEPRSEPRTAGDSRTAEIVALRPANDAGRPRYIDVQTDRAAWAAKRQEIAYRKEAGELCEVAGVQRAVGELVGDAVKQLESLGPRIATEIAGRTGSDARLVQSIIDVEVERVRDKIAGTARALAERTRNTSQ